MAVILANASLAVGKKSRPSARDAYGAPVSGPDVVTYGPLRAAALRERADTGAEQGVEWSVRLEPEEWPVEKGDHLTDVLPAGDVHTGRVWVVTSANLNTLVGYSDVDYIAVTAVPEVPEVL